MLRLLIGCLFIYHGTMKLALWGPVDPAMQMSGTMLSILRMLSILEPLAGLALIIGLFSQVASLGLILVMISAMYTKIPAGAPFTKWELDLILLVINVVAVVIGPGKYSLDYALSAKKKK